jgi:hypothetical protein
MLPEIPYGACMRTPIDEPIEFCTECDHSEFVHSDRGDRLCLFSECNCSGFEVHRSAAFRLHEPDEASG